MKPTVLSIDPPFSRDLDDAVSAVRDGDGWIVDVCVPDVPALVEVGDAMDARSMDRVATRYGGSFVKEPMLSEGLVEALSLTPRRDTPMCWFRIRLAADLSVAHVGIERIVHRTADRLTYLEADEALERPRDRAHAEVRAMWDLASALHARRRARTGAAFDPTAHLYTTEEGILAHLGEKESHRSHLIVMEFMILANGALADHARANGIPVIYRNHVPRDASSGLREDVLREMREIEGVDADEAADRLRRLSSRIGPAGFGTSSEGHWGLDVRNYAWFTSPLRRACDIVNLRAIVHGAVHEDLGARAARIETVTREVRESSSRHHALRARAAIARLVASGDREGLAQWGVHTIVRACAETRTSGPAVAAEALDRMRAGSVSGKDMEAVLTADASIMPAEAKEAMVEWLLGDAQRQLVFARDMVLRQRIARVPTLPGGQPDLAAAMREIATAAGFDLPQGWEGAASRTHVDVDPVVDHPNPKGALLELATARKAEASFEETARVGPSHEPRFTVEARWRENGVDTVESASASGVKLATRAAAHALLLRVASAADPTVIAGDADAGKPAKSLLLERAAKTGARVEFDPPTRTGPPHAPSFAVTARYLSAGAETVGSGVAGSRREAERLASEEILAALAA